MLVLASGNAGSRQAMVSKGRIKIVKLLGRYDL
jgi:hypothetical protein